jgi:hypothetical protein
LVTTEEIDKFVDQLMDEKPGEDYAQRLGTKTWYTFHRIADKYGCPTCQPGAEKLINVDHNTVNIHLGKPVVNPKLYEDGIAMVFEAYKKYKTQHSHKEHHSENVRIGKRMVHVVSDDPGAIESLKESLHGATVSH